MADQDLNITTATPPASETTGTTPPSTQLESGTYEIIKNRLLQHGKNLKQKLEQLNDSRKKVFGSIETTLLSSERIITRHNCIPRDMVPIGDCFIFGYNVHMGLKTSINLEDVFSVYEYKNRQFKEIGPNLITDEKFNKDFCELYKYYRLTQFLQFFVAEPYLYMVFQVGKTVSDIKAFKWLIKEDTLLYQDNRNDHEIRYPSQHDFEWTRTRRENHRYGLHPHISIEDRLFVETVGGDLTIKVEDNTSSGMGIYAENVDNPDQTLDDADILYATIGNLILLKIRPYQEQQYRYLLFNEKMQQVNRLDAIKDSCIFLPDDHGLIFPNGYYLQSGEFKTFDIQLENMRFLQRIPSTNGEDFQYIFYNPEIGIYLILSYNLISQTVAPPIICSGLSHFKNGEMIIFKREEEARKNHVLQVWQTPFVGRDYVADTINDSLLFKIGNPEIVRCMAQCQSTINLIRKEEGYVNLYVDIAKESAIILDTYFWLDKDEAFHIKDILTEIHTTAASAVEEYEKVVRIKTTTRQQIDQVKLTSDKLFKEITFASFDLVDDYVKTLAQLRTLRGDVISLKDLRYTDLPLIESLETHIKEKNEELSRKCIQFLLQPEGLQPYQLKINEQFNRVDQVQKGSEGKQLAQELTQTASELELLIDIVSNLKIEDPTQTTTIIDRISTIYASLNQAKSKLQNRMKDLHRTEGETEFNSQVKLVNQTVVNYLSVVDTPEKCEEYLSKVMVQLEELEGKFADFDEFLPQLTEKREELYSAFESKKLAILEQRNKKATSLLNAAERILTGLQNRLKSLTSVSEINGYFASDLMVAKTRDIIDQLLAIGDPVKADDIQCRLKTIREDAIRQLKDKQDLFVHGENIIKFGNHLFNVNTQNLDLSIVQRDNQLYFHLTGTDFWQKVDSPELETLHPVWNLEILSETPEVYRAEYLAYKIIETAQTGSFLSIDELARLSPAALLETVQQFMAPRYRETYTKGLHDRDGAQILKALLDMHRAIDLLTYTPSARALATLYWFHHHDDQNRQLIHTRLKSLNTVSRFFKTSDRLDPFIQSIQIQLQAFIDQTHLFDPSLINPAAQYLCREIMRSDSFVISAEAALVYQQFIDLIKQKNADIPFSHSLDALTHDLPGAFFLAQEWLTAFLNDNTLNLSPDGKRKISIFIDEVTVLLLTRSFDLKNVIPIKTSITLENLLGVHPILQAGQYHLSYNSFIDKLRHHDQHIVPQFLQFQELKKSLTEELKTQLRLDEFRSRVLSSFVRNQLIDKVYLPLIGDNLAKQIGVAGESKRTDLMGLLLLVSPPGYGKTTLMEYIANRLGLIFVKINGPAIGHQVTSLDPAETKNTAAREELKKLNLALEMGNNIMIYVDDIQHCHPEFLQKFISLCDAQRKIEGIFNGIGRTYDFRGKKVAVVMAGNPYTESGEKFKIPDMLANRADVYNLGDMLRENEEAFKLSFIENCLTSNPVLNQLITRSRKDVYTLIEAAQNNIKESLDLEGNYSHEEINEFINVLHKLSRVRNIVLDINREYIRSAAQTDEYRTEPPFKLQGSYRNMNRIAERILPVLNDQELESIIEGAYENDAQTLTTGAEANLLKWKEIAGRLTDKNLQRWEEIKTSFRKGKLVKSDDKIGQAVLQLNEVNLSLTGIKDAISHGLIEQSQSVYQLNLKSQQQHQDSQTKYSDQLQHNLNQIKQTIHDGFSLLEKTFQELTASTRTVTENYNHPTPAFPFEELNNTLIELKNTIASRPISVSAIGQDLPSTPPPSPNIPTSPATNPQPTYKAELKLETKPGVKPRPKPSTNSQTNTTPTTSTPPIIQPITPTQPGKPPQTPKTDSPQLVVPDKLEVWIERFRTISPDMAKRLAAENSSLAQEGIRFGNDYRLANASIEGFGNQRILLLLWECLKIPAAGEKEKIQVSLIKDKQNSWESEMDFSDSQHVFIKGDMISGRVKLDTLLFRSADQLGIRLSHWNNETNSWHDLTVFSNRQSDQNRSRLLIDLEFRHKF